MQLSIVFTAPPTSSWRYSISWNARNYQRHQHLKLRPIKTKHHRGFSNKYPCILHSRYVPSGELEHRNTALKPSVLPTHHNDLSKFHGDEWAAANAVLGLLVWMRQAPQAWTSFHTDSAWLRLYTRTSSWYWQSPPRLQRRSQYTSFQQNILSQTTMH